MHISLAPLQGHYYSEAQHEYCVGVSRRTIGSYYLTLSVLDSIPFLLHRNVTVRHMLQWGRQSAGHGRHRQIPSIQRLP